MKLVFLYGPPGVGKLTVARELSALTGFPLFHNHLVVDLLTSTFEFGSEPFVELREKIWLEVFEHAARNKTSLIFTFAPERTVRPTFVPAANAVVENTGGKVCFVQLTCRREELEQRITDGSRARFGKLHSLEQFRALSDAGAFEYPPLPAAITIDTTSVTPGEAARRIHEWLSARSAGVASESAPLPKPRRPL